MQTLAVVLAGGASRRMGTSKALLDWHGQPLLRHVIDRLRPGFERVVVVGGEVEGILPPDVEWLADDQPGAGVAAAILTALRHYQQACFVCACDMPFVHAGFGRWLLENARDCAVHVPYWQGLPQPLHAVWCTGAIVWLEESLRAGEYAVWRVLQRMESAGTLLRAQEETVRAFDAEGRCFVNLNTPEEWRRWSTLRQGGEMVE